MDVMEAIMNRHSIRRYTDEPISEEDLETLQAEIDRCNKDGDLDIQLICNGPDIYTSPTARKKFDNVNNFIVVAGHGMRRLSERGGYYGERLVIMAKILGLDTCWTTGSYNKTAVKKAYTGKGKIIAVIAIGHAAEEPTHHKIKRFREVCKVPREMEDGAPKWFDNGLKAALHAPTFANSQGFSILLYSRVNEKGLPYVHLIDKGSLYSKLSLGIVRQNFELAVTETKGKPWNEVFEWAKNG